VVDLEDFIGIRAEHLAPGSRLLLRRGQQVGRYRAGKLPDSFSTCIIRIVCCSASIFFRWRISVAKAVLSASSVLRDSGESTSIGWPSGRMVCGKRLGSFFTQAGT
jgi:hypothetical protein